MNSAQARISLTRRMNNSNVLGITLCVVGAVLLALAYRASNTPVEQLADALTGSYTNRTMWYLIGGIAAVVGGGLLVMRGRRSA